MRLFSAVDAVSPAFSRTKLILFSPFRFGRTWKLCATAYLTKAGVAFFPFPLLFLFLLPAAKQWRGGAGVGLLVVSVLLATGFFYWLFYLCSRIQFAFFDIVLNRGEFVAPAWRKYGPQSAKWTVVKAVLGTVVTLLMAAPVIAYVRHIIPIMNAIKPGEQPPPEFMTAIFAGYGIIFLGIGGLFLIAAVLSDFIVPSLALEDVTLSEGFRRFFLLVRNEPGQFAAYVALKIAFAIGGYIAVLIAFEIVLLVLMLVVVLIGALIGLFLHVAGVSTAVLGVIAVIAGIPIYLFIVGYGTMLTVGPLFTFLEAYTLYFLGGRYPLLGDLLERSTPVREVPPSPPGYPTFYPYPPSDLPPV